MVQVETLIDAEPAADPFEPARLERPGCKFVRFIDRGLGVEFTAAVSPGTPWFDLFPDTQTVEIQRGAL